MLFKVLTWFGSIATLKMPNMTRLPNKFKDIKGQALLIVLLSLAVVLTIVLYVLSRSVTDISISGRSEQSLRAFSAAEAGVEKALIIGGSLPQTDIGDASYTANVSGAAFGGTSFNYPLLLASGDSSTLWFVSHGTNGDLVCGGGKCFTGSKLKICWGASGTSSSSPTTPAIEANIYYAATPGNYSSLRIARAAFDPNSDRRLINSFSAPGSGNCTINTEVYEFQTILNFSQIGIPPSSYNNEDGLQFVKVNMFYNTDIQQKIGFDVNFAGNSLLPSQGLKIESTGTAGDANRKIEVFQGWGEVPQIFNSVVFSGSGITK